MAKPAPALKPTPPPPRETTAYSIERRADNCWVYVTVRLRSGEVVDMSESEPDTLSGTLGRLVINISRSMTA
jgi:hypothetical protein